MVDGWPVVGSIRTSELGGNGFACPVDDAVVRPGVSSPRLSANATSATTPASAAPTIATRTGDRRGCRLLSGQTCRSSACPTSAASAPAVGYRSFGSFAIAFATTASTAPGSSGRADVTVGGAFITWPYITVASSSPVNGGSPVRHSNNTQPREYTSVRPSSGLPSNCSGEAYLKVPANTPVPVRLESDAARLLSPKSAR